jgi:hypothetical protein
VFQTIRTALREPLSHFLLAGAGLFLLFSYAVDSPDVADDEIVITSGQIEHLTTIFVKTWQRSPTTEELRGLIDSYILEEVLYREAVAVGLDQDDTIIRRRLKQKMEFLVDDFSAADPSDDVLQSFLDSDPERFRTEASISFEHVYLVEADASAVDDVLMSLQDDRSFDPDIAIPSGLLPRQFDDASETMITSQFGESFKTAIFALGLGQWTGPVESPFGTHLIRVEQIMEGRVPALDEIRGVVQREWLVDRREAAQQMFFDSLRDKYTIRIEDYVAPGL